MKKLLLFIGSLVFTAANQAQIIHVPGDFTTIQQGINAANPGDTVLVAEGTYFEQINFLGKKPLMVASLFLMDSDISHISKTIIDGSQLTNMDNASLVYFISGEDTTSILCGFTIQHGKGNYITSDNDREGGGIWISQAGAKIIHNRITHNILDDTQYSNGNGVCGAGIASRWEDADYWVVIGNNIIDSNTCISKYGYAIAGGIGTFYNSRIIDNVVSSNSCSGMLNALAAAGGIDCEQNPAWINNGVAIIEHNTIIHNLAQSQNNLAYSAGVFIGCKPVIFSHNEVAYNTVVTGKTDAGGAAGLELYQPDPGSVVSNNVFKGNVSNWVSGGLHLENSEILDNSVLVENNYFIDNIAKYGGAFASLSVPVTLQNNVFNRNQAENWGGAVYLCDNLGQLNDHLATLINNSFSGNTATDFGGAICSTGINPFILNSIFWQDSATTGMEIYAELGTLEIAYSDIDPGLIQGTYIDGGGLINKDPLFTNLEILKTVPGSPCVDTGIIGFTCNHGLTFDAPAFDILGIPRPQGVGYDMGAYEYSAIIHVPADYPTIQAGIDAANPGNTVLVAEGTYYEQINFKGKKPLMVASEFLMDGDTSHISKTIIDGSHAANPDSASVVYFISGEDTTSILCGFTIQGGKGTYWDIWESMGGAGIYITHSTATIRNNIIQNNELNDTLTADLWGCCGGGILVSYGTPGWVVIKNNRIVNNKVYSNHLYANGGGFQVYITNTRIQNNIVSNNLTKNTGIGVGGYAGPAGIMCESDTVPMIAIIRDNLVENNETRAYEAGYGAGMGTWLLANGSVIENNRIINNMNDWNGGGLDIYSSSFTTYKVENNYFIGNEAMNGGAIDVEWDTTSQVLLTNNVFNNNSAANQGGVIWINRGNVCPVQHMVVSTNNTFYSNHADSAGGAIYTYNDNPMILNSIFWQNSDLAGNTINVESGTVEIAYSDLDSNKIAGTRIIGAGMINADPLFSDVTLLTTENWSPCVDKGTKDYTCNCGDTFHCPGYDITGTTRPVGTGYDMGAYDLAGTGGVERITNYGLRITNWPNPFIESTTFVYTLKEQSQVTLQIFNSFGQMVDEPVITTQQTGEQKVQWNAGNLPVGIYFYRIQAGKQVGSGKMVKIQ